MATTRLAAAARRQGDAHLQALLGGTPTTVRIVTEGYTPGSKRIVRDAAGRLLFVKFAPAGSWMAESYALEAAAHDWLPESASGGLLVGRLIDGVGVTLVFRAIDEPVPGSAGWTTARQLGALLEALPGVYGDLDDAAPADLASEVRTFWAAQSFWRDCAAGTLRPPRGLGRALVSSLAEAEARAAEAMAAPMWAHEVCHHDLRRDNVLLGRGSVHVIDWNWVNRGPRVGDAVCLGIDAAVHGLDPEAVLRPDGPFGHYDAGTVNAALAAAAGYFASAARVRADTPAALTRARRAGASAGVAWFARRVRLS